MSHVAYIRFDWEPAGPLHTGYGLNLAEYTGRRKRGERSSINLETHPGPDQPLTPAFLASSVKGVFRSASAWLVERVARELGSDRFVTCDYWTAVPERWPTRKEAPSVAELCPICQVYGGAGCLAQMGARGETPFLRRRSAVSFTFDDRNDAYNAPAEFGTPYTFAWQVVEGKGQELKVEQLQVPRGGVRLEARIEPAAPLGVALVCLSADLIGAGFFRFGRFTSRGYGVVRLRPQAAFYGTLAEVFNLEGDPCRPVDGHLAGYEIAQQLLPADPRQIIRRVVQEWMTGLG